MRTKTCNTCGQDKDATPDNFRRTPRSPDGLSARCKLCARGTYRRAKAEKEARKFKARRRDLCGWGGRPLCDNAKRPGGHTCPEHYAVLEPIKAAFEAEEEAGDFSEGSYSEPYAWWEDA